VSRSAVLLALLAFALVGLAPVVSMFLRVDGADLAAVFQPRTLELLGRTLGLGLASASLALCCGGTYGFLVSRTDLPWAGFLRTAGVVPLLLPPLILAVSWSAMTTIRGGWATILVMAVSTFPLVAMYTARAFERIDARREEAALLAGGLGAVVRMELPLVLPSAACAACFAFCFAINDFTVPDYVSSIGPKYNVYADEVFSNWRSAGDSGRAVASALPLVLLTLAALIPAIQLRRRTLLDVQGGDFRRPAPLELGPWRWPAFGLCLALFAVTVAAPLGRLLFEAGGGPRGWSLGAFSSAFSRSLELGREQLRTSLWMSTAAALLCLPVALVLGHALDRSRNFALQAVVLLPLSVPAILFGIGNIAFWNRPLTGALYDSSWMAVVLMVGRFAPLAILALAAGVAMVDRRQEDAAALAGAPPHRTLLWIVGPQLWGALCGSATLVFVLSMREIDAAVFVPAANSTAMFKLYNQVHFGREDFVAATALLVVAFVLLPGLLWSLFVRRRLEVLP
jgi:iron(III) transport system permease protein